MSPMMYRGIGLKDPFRTIIKVTMKVTGECTEHAQKYREQGFAVLRLHSDKELSILETFAKNWVYRLLDKWIKGRKEEFPLNIYHTWWGSLGIDHDNLFKASNRHCDAGQEIKNILVNNTLVSFLASIGIQHFNLWDEGLGWLGFRFIRPGYNDGYPMSRKEWGLAKKVISFWVPIIGFSERETLALVPRSHLRKYRKYLPSNTKFRKGEYRLAHLTKSSEIYRPSLEKGEAIVYHPRILHTEDVKESDVTRLNIEVRIIPS